MKVIITGASGVLGTAVYAAFNNAGHNVLGLAHSRAGNGLVKLDLLDQPAVENAFADFKPDSERRPDVAEKDPDATQKLNAELPARLAQLAPTLKFHLVYISTDYVFDGTAAPYAPATTPNPVNLYGRTKRDGELAVLAARAAGADAIVLRVPVLYGPAPKNSDTAVNILIDVVEDQSGKQYKMDHYATRFPTNVVDIAAFLPTGIVPPPPSAPSALQKPIPPVLHYSASEPFTKYEMCLVFAQLLGLSHAHIVADAEVPTGAAAISRPRNCQLNTAETEALLGGPGSLECSIFEEWWAENLKGGSAGMSK
ncbi:hypothetical protein EW145_g4379 [Phellinidium pouzarii]|uniref:RmlD-like substrate binding domain-containing protein n=1 Tax=Phellinidium pouzarii TaxID=167371 RepID=A0A4S4L477_9AGAM|nr:hypothetical protein EW145_g4379 [Phellinidium pouzarii]